MAQKGVRSYLKTLFKHTDEKNKSTVTKTETGKNESKLSWSEHSLPNSPFLGYAVPVTSDANKVIIKGPGWKETTVKQETEFIIDGSQAGPGVPEVTLLGVRGDIPNKIVPLGNGHFQCTYTPVFPGGYLLYISWNGQKLEMSPTKLNVIEAGFPHKVIVSGEGLKGGIVGQSCDVLIDVRKAGQGELAYSCIGPTKMTYCELKDYRDGTFVLAIRPQKPGKHVLHVKYGGEHVLGSPFMIRVRS